MLHYIKKDVTTVEQGIVVHGVNCQGVMGSGVALAIRTKWPKAYDKYKELCEGYVHTRPLLLGTAHYVKLGDQLFVGNWFTQVYYGGDGKKYADENAVEACFVNSIGFIESQNLPLYLPRIGCGLGGLSWDNEVEPIVSRFSQEYKNVEIYVCDL